jgi:hypothetical protein
MAWTVTPSIRRTKSTPANMLPLVIAAHLQGAAVAAVQFQIIVGLQQLVIELK